MKKVKDKLTILIDKDVKERYKEFCEKIGLKIGKQVEIFMQKELDRETEEKKGGKK